jgi:hypothetical protein
MKWLSAASVGIVACLGFVVSPANAGNITNPVSGPFAVPGNPGGFPLAFSVSGTGFPASAPIFAEMCDGSDPNAGTLGDPWLPTEHCDLGNSNAPVSSDATGNVAFDPTDLNHRFLPLEGLSKQGLFNCLAPNDPKVTAPGYVEGQSDPDNLAPDWTTCKLRVSTGNTVVTPDQAFLQLTLPNIVNGTKSPYGTIDCTANLQEAIKPGVQGTYLKAPKSFTIKSLKQDTTKNIAGSAAGAAVPGGSCDTSNVRGGKAPITAATIKMSYKVGAPWDCNPSGANNLLRPNVLAGGKIQVKWESGPVAGKFVKVDSSKTLLTNIINTGLLPSTKFQIQTAPILKGAFAGYRLQMNVVSDVVGSGSPPSLTDTCQNHTDPKTPGLTSMSFTVAGSDLTVVP